MLAYLTSGSGYNPHEHGKETAIFQACARQLWDCVLAPLVIWCSVYYPVLCICDCDLPRKHLLWQAVQHVCCCRHFDVSTTGMLEEVKEGLALAFLEKMVSRDELWITATVSPLCMLGSTGQHNLHHMLLARFAYHCIRSLTYDHTW